VCPAKACGVIVKASPPVTLSTTTSTSAPGSAHPLISGREVSTLSPSAGDVMTGTSAFDGTLTTLNVLGTPAKAPM